MSARRLAGVLAVSLPCLGGAAWMAAHAFPPGRDPGMGRVPDVAMDAAATRLDPGLRRGTRVSRIGDASDLRLDEPARWRAQLARAQAPWFRLAARTMALALAPPSTDRDRRLAIARATLALWAPAVAARTGPLREALARAEQDRAEAWLRPQLAEAGFPLRAPTWRLAPCATAALHPPVDGPALKPLAAAALGRGGVLTFATAPGAPVRAPAAGQVSYAGPFRRYGRIVVIDHGHGWTSLLTNLADLQARTGQPVATGVPLGRAPAHLPLIGMELRHHGRPVDPAAMMARCGA